MTIAQQNLATYGVADMDAYFQSAKNSITYKFTGGFMLVASLMSDAQEQMAFGDVEGARKTLNLAKFLQFKIADGQLEFKNVEVV